MSAPIPPIGSLGYRQLVLEEELRHKMRLSVCQDGALSIASSLETRADRCDRFGRHERAQDLRQKAHRIRLAALGMLTRETDREFSVQLGDRERLEHTDATLPADRPLASFRGKLGALRY